MAHKRSYILPKLNNKVMEILSHDKKEPSKNEVVPQYTKSNYGVCTVPLTYLTL